MNTYIIAKDINRPFVRHIYWKNDSVSPMTLADELEKDSENFQNISVKRKVSMPEMATFIWSSRVTVSFTKGEHLKKNILLHQIVSNVFNQR